VVVCRKSLGEVQYLCTNITEEQRREFGRFVEGTIRRIESADFLPRGGIRFPQNPYSSCPYVDFCLGKRRRFRTEQTVLVGLTSLITRNPPMRPKFNRRRAVFDE
jgi:hypothetical protein